jgi:hypothetical protein
MSKTLSKLEKPPIKDFERKRKLYCIPLLLYDKDSLEEYLKLIEQYWNQVDDHIKKLEKAGKIQRIYHESNSLSGEKGLSFIESISERSHKFTKEKVEQGAIIEAFENKELQDIFQDWSMCLLVTGRSKSVTEKIQNLAREAYEKRIKHLSSRIDETLKIGEAGVLISNEDLRMRIQPNLASDIQIFLVHPPSLNDITRWLRDHFDSKKFSINNI